MGKAIDLTGQKFGRLTVLKRCGKLYFAQWRKKVLSGCVNVNVEKK